MTHSTTLSRTRSALGLFFNLILWISFVFVAFSFADAPTEKGKPSPGVFSFRQADKREKMLREGGGTAESEAAVASGLKWLSEHQGPDGRWSLKNFHELGKCNCTGETELATADDVAATAFGLLPFMGAGHTTKSGEFDEKKYPYAKLVDKGLRYLIQQQNADGSFVSASPGVHQTMYSNGLATIALCEAYALSFDPALREPAQKAINYIVDAQTKEGGWRYLSRKNGAVGYDTSVGGWQFMALKSGQMAGLDVPAETWKNCEKWLDDAASPDGGKYCYTKTSKEEVINGEKVFMSSLATNSIGLLAREYMGWGPQSKGLIAGAKKLNMIGPKIDQMYYTYYGTQVTYHLGGMLWEEWNKGKRENGKTIYKGVREILIAAQDKGDTDKHEHQQGSWLHAEGDKTQAGRLMTTSLAIMTLEVYYRHLPLYRRELQGDKALREK